MSEYLKIEAEITFLSAEDGGRQHPPSFVNPMAYRPHIVVGDGEYLGTIFLTAPERVSAGCSFFATLGLVYHPEVDYSALVPGVAFAIREGVRTVGHGQVIRRWTEVAPSR